MIDVYTGVIKVIFVMLGIIAVIVLLARYSGKLKIPFRTETQNYGLKKVGSLYLGYKKVVSVIEVKDHVLVVGVGDKELSLLAEWKKEETQS
jgi:flagellar biogenesis protein FliO